MTSGSASSIVTLSEILTAQMSRPLYDFPIEKRETIDGCAAATAATSVVFPGLVGLLPGVGRFDPLDWGLGFELHDGKVPHWMPGESSPATFGHMGGSGGFLWIDPDAAVAMAGLSDRDYGPWALEAWPPLGDRVLALVETG